MNTTATANARLRIFIRQAPGFNVHNYSDAKGLNRDRRAAQNQRREALNLLDAADKHGVDLAGRTGRISVTADNIDYITGQYFPTEFRKAAAYHIEQRLLESGITADAVARIRKQK